MVEEADRRPVQPAPESRRHLTILFTDLSDSTRLSALLEVEVYAELQDEVRLAFTTIVADHGGSLNQFQGDGLQALFGSPRPTEYDGRRAVEAALEMHARVRALRGRYAAPGAPPLSVHSGIHAGLILPRRGDAMGARVELFGAAPGIAKHLSDIAEADEILVSDETLGPVSHLFETVDRRLVTLKGRAEPLAIQRIVGATGLRTRFEAHRQRGLVPFIGREAELAWLGRALASVASGHSRFVAVSGPPGVGKTRLADEFLRRAAAAGWGVSRGYCDSELSAEPLQPFVQMLRARFELPPGTSAAAAAEALGRGLAAIDPALPAQRDDLLQALSIQPDVPAGAAAAKGAPAQALAALRRLFEALARRGPQLVLIDDWHWADDATRQVVFAIRALTGLPILLLATTRPLEAGDARLSDADVLDLGTFTDAEADRTIAELLPAADPFVAGQIRRHAGGNALFIEELCHSAAVFGPREALEPLLGGPVWLETLIETRVARLPREQSDVLNAAAVIGNVVPLPLLESLTGCGPQHPLLRDLARRDLLFPGEAEGSLRFKHGITRDVVYAALGMHQRRVMHQDIARLLRAAAEPGAEAEACEALAYHHAGAAEFEPAARFAEMAGDKAMAASSIDRAKLQYRVALQMLDRLGDVTDRYPTWRSLVRRLGMASVFDPARDDLAVFRLAVERARAHADAAGLAYAEYWLAYVHYALGETRLAVEHCGFALGSATKLGDPRLVAQARATLGQALAAAADYGPALELLGGVEQALRDRPSGARPGPGASYTLACKASVLGDLGRFDEAHACFELALEALPGHGHEVEGSVRCWRSGVFLWQGRWQAARDDALAAQRVAERVKSLYLFAMSRGLGAYAAWRIERSPQALREMAEAIDWLESRDKGLFVSLGHGWLAEAMAEEGRGEAARRHAARALRRARKRDWIGAAMASRAMARLAAQGRDWPAAERHLARAAKVAAIRKSPHEAACNALCRAEVEALRGERGAAHAALDRAITAFNALGMEWHSAQAQALALALRPRSSG